MASDKAAADAAQVALADMAHDVLPDGTSVDLTAAVENSAGEEIYHARSNSAAKRPNRHDLRLPISKPRRMMRLKQWPGPLMRSRTREAEGGWRKGVGALERHWQDA
ncbi:DUF6894 family protein [Bosea sp. NBC_00550]|uniref:DUF6894 family protein n=1 Tax=Bosea sp. NBC_00550 TaxID=2969621 RepID=UPI003FA43831